MLSHKWTKKERDLATGDVVLLAEAKNDNPTYRMSIVDSVKPGEDGHVQTVNIRHTNPEKTPGERPPPKITTRPNHKIAVIVPVDYVFKDDHGIGTDGLGLPMLTQAEASNQGGDAPAQPDPPTRASSDQSPARRPNEKHGAKHAPSKVKEEATDKPGPVVGRLGRDPLPPSTGHPPPPSKLPI